MHSNVGALAPIDGRVVTTFQIQTALEKQAESSQIKIADASDDGADTENHSFCVYWGAFDGICKQNRPEIVAVALRRRDI